MKKSIKKVCSIALALASTTATAATAIVLTPDTNGHVQLHADQAASSLTYLEIAGGQTTATIGSEYTIPAASLSVNGTKTQVAVSDITVYSPINEVVDVDGGKFDVERLGEYRIVYAVEDNDTTYTGEFKFKAVLGQTSIKVKTNTSRILPKKVWQSYTGDLFVPEAELEFANEDEEVDYTITTRVTDPDNTELAVDSTTGKITYTSLKQGIYSVNYTAKTDKGVFLATLTQEFEVLADTKYSSDYTLKFDLGSMPTAADVGETISLPEPTGKRESEEVPVYYTIEAWTYEDGELVNVSERTINGKKVIEGNQFTACQKGDYVFYYTVKDALGKEAEKKTVSINDVTDTKAPTIMVVDATATTKVDVAHKLQSYFENGQNIVIPAIYAEDLADSLDKLTLSRIIRAESQIGTSSYKYSEEEDANKANFSKTLVFNKTDDFTLTEDMVDAGDLEDGKYTIYYKAKDSSGNVETINYTFTVDSSFTFTKAPTVEFKDTFAKSVKPGDVITFSAPETKDEYDERLLTEVFVRYDEGEWTLVEAEEDGTFKIKVSDSAAKLTIRAKATNDAPLTSAEETADANISAYTGFKYGYDEVSMVITTNEDKEAPVFVSIADQTPEYYVQNSEIVLPSITLEDDLVDYLNVKVQVKHQESEQEFNVYDGAVVRAARAYSLLDAKFYATLSGKYDVVYTAKDAAGNQVVAYQTIEVASATIIEEPRMANLPETLTDGKLEFGSELTLPVPELKVSSNLEAEYRISVKGPMNYELNKEKFVPGEVGTYTIVYSLWTKEAGNAGAQFAEVEDAKREYVVNVADTTKPTVRVEWNLKDSYDKNASALIPVFSADDQSGINLETSNVRISSDHYTKTIYAKDFAKQLEIYNGWKDEEARIAAGETIDTRKYPDAGSLYVTFRYDEKYTVTYTVFDKSNSSNSTVVTHSIKVGDLVQPVIDVADDIVSSIVKIDSVLSIDTDKIEISDNLTEMSLEDLEIVVKNTSTNTVLKNIHADAGNGKFEYNIETAGEYTITFSAKDANGNTGTFERTFTVNEPSNEGLSQTEVIGTVLIVVAVLVLGGVIVYFVVSKKKLDKMYK